MSDSCNPRDYSPPGSSVHGISQARILEWVAMPSSRGSSRPREWTQVSNVSCFDRQILYKIEPPVKPLFEHSAHLFAAFTKLEKRTNTFKILKIKLNHILHKYRMFTLDFTLLFTISIRSMYLYVALLIVLSNCYMDVIRNGSLSFYSFI